MTDLAKRKIDFILQKLNTEAKGEFKGAILDLIEEIQQQKIFEPVKEKYYSLGFINGATHQKDLIDSNSVVDNISENLKTSYLAVEERILLSSS